MTFAKSLRNLTSVMFITVAVFCLTAVGQMKSEAGKDPATSIAPPQLMIRVGHAEIISSAAISPDNKYVLTGSHDKTARLWDAQTGTEIHSFQGHSGEVNTVSISPDGRYVLTGGEDDTARLWDIETGKELRKFEHSHPVKSAEFLPDSNHLLTVDLRGAIRLWDIKGGKELRSFGDPSEMVWTANVSLDGKRVLILSANKIAQLWDIETGKSLRSFETRLNRAWAAALSPDGKRVLIGGEEANEPVARMWDAETGKELYKLEDNFMVMSAAFSSDGKYVVIGGIENALQMREVETGRKVREFKVSVGVFMAAAVSRDGKYLLGAFGILSATLWDTNTGEEVSEFNGQSVRVKSAAFSPDGKYVLIGGFGRRTMLWDLETGRQVLHVAMHSDGVTSVAFSHDGRRMLTGSFDHTAFLIDLEAEKIYQLKGHTNAVLAVAFSPDGKYVLTGSRDNTARLWNAETGQELRKFEGHTDDINDVAFSPDSKFVLTGSSDKTARLWDAETGKELHKLEADSISVVSVAFSPDGAQMITGGSELRVWDAETQKELFNLSSPGLVMSLALSPDGGLLLVGDSNGTATLWDFKKRSEIRSFKGHLTGVTSVAFSPDGRHVLTTGGLDATTRLWNISNGEEVCKLIAFFDREWAVVAPDGRFDAGNLDDIEGLSWIVPDDPMHPVPLEIFMRDYYEPRLLPRLLDDIPDEKQFNPVRSLQGLNRVQPEVKIVDAQPLEGSPDAVAVTVEVSRVVAERKRGSKELDETGVFDLRLFRDGQLVSYLPTPNTQLQPPSLNEKVANRQAADAQLQSWRRDAEVQLTDGKLTKTFTVKLPHRQNLKEVTFTAYAFNHDRVRSKIARKTYTLATPLTSRKGKAYIISVGVNLSEIFQGQPIYNLNNAAADAEATSEQLFESLKQVGDYEDVVRIKLVADEQVKTAVKPNLRAVLAVLAGKMQVQEFKRLIPGAEQLLPDIDRLGKATPDDLVIISVSSHGAADDKGNFFLYPYDTGHEQTRVLGRSISSEELSLWLLDVDAGDLLMVIDACQSGAAPGEGFKAGPMDSRGLGQLAYDKGMKILTATQADSAALEIDDLELNGKVIRGGLLTYVLIDEAIKEKKAMDKENKVITATGWMEYAVARVPQMYEEVEREYEKQNKETGNSKLGSKGVRRRIILGRDGRKRLTFVFRDTGASELSKRQRPMLFDFTKKTQEVVIARF